MRIEVSEGMLEKGFKKVREGGLKLEELARLVIGEGVGKREEEELREKYEEWEEGEEKEERKRGGEEEEILSKREVEKYLSRMGRGEGVSGKDQLQALSLYIRLKGWGNVKEEEGGVGLGEELSEMLKRDRER